MRECVNGEGRRKRWLRLWPVVRLGWGPERWEGIVCEFETSVYFFIFMFFKMFTTLCSTRGANIKGKKKISGAFGASAMPQSKDYKEKRNKCVCVVCSVYIKRWTQGGGYLIVGMRLLIWTTGFRAEETNKKEQPFTFYV